MSSPESKMFHFTRILIYGINPPARATKGNDAHRHVALARVAMDACCVGGLLFAGRKRGSGRRSRVVLAPRPWRQAAGKTHAVTVAKKAAHRGEHEVSRKPLRGESRDVSAVPVKSVCVLRYFQHTVLRAP